jgi:hypothetical protein
VSAPAPALELRLIDWSYGPRMLEIDRACPIVADLTFHFDRTPDFFAWPNAVFDRGYVYGGGFLEGRLVAHALFGWASGQLPWGDTFAWTGDARVLPEARGSGFLAAAARAAAEVMPSSGVGLALVKRGNEAATRALAAARLPGVELAPLCEFRAVNLLLAGPLPRPRRFQVRRAAEGDRGAIAELTARAWRGRPFAPTDGEGALRRDLDALPGFALDRHYLAFRGDELVGCAGAWDAGPVRRIAVVAWSARGRLARAAYHGARRLLPLGPPLPGPGECFRTVTTTRVAVPSGDPAVLHDLLAAICRDHAGDGYHLVHVGFCTGDPLSAAVRGFLRFSFRSDLLLAAAPDRAAALRTGPPPYLDLRFP